MTNQGLHGDMDLVDVETENGARIQRQAHPYITYTTNTKIFLKNEYDKPPYLTDPTRLQWAMKHGCIIFGVAPAMK